MHSQLIAFPLSTLLKQYPKASLCCRPQLRLQAAPQSSKSLYPLLRCRRHWASSQTTRYRRQLRTQHGLPLDHSPLLLSASPTKVDSRQQSSLKGLQNETGRDGRGLAHRKQIAVLGGGISGLSCAYYLTREFPSAKITLYEASNRLGGWVHTEVVDGGFGAIAFEQGPRTLQPNRVSSLVTFDLVS